MLPTNITIGVGSGDEAFAHTSRSCKDREDIGYVLITFKIACENSGKSVLNVGVPKM